MFQTDTALKNNFYLLLLETANMGLKYIKDSCIHLNHPIIL